LDTALFACVHNAGRSQMAAAWFNKLCDPKKAIAISAGTQPGERVHHGVVETMLEVGIDLSTVRPRLLTTEVAQRATLLVTMGCGDTCPYVSGLKKLDWPLQDPEGQSIEVVRKIRDEIRQRVLDLSKGRDWLKEAVTHS
jgi:arsenate reductase